MDNNIDLEDEIQSYLSWRGGKHIARIVRKLNPSEKIILASPKSTIDFTAIKPNNWSSKRWWVIIHKFMESKNFDVKGWDIQIRDALADDDQMYTSLEDDDDIFRIELSPYWFEALGSCLLFVCVDKKHMYKNGMHDFTLCDL